MKDLIESAISMIAMRNRSLSDRAASTSLERSLHAIRTHLDMDVAFISEFSEGRRYFRYVSSEPDGPVQVGGSDPIEDSYCMRVIEGRLPELIPDACINIEALTLAATRALPVGAHLSVPIRLSDGRVYGTFCCFSHAPDDSLTPRDLGMMRVFADIVADQIETDLKSRDAAREAGARIDAAMVPGALHMVYQPIVHVAEQRVVGFEALARFKAEPVRPPDLWFAEAAGVGRSVELESLAIGLALQAFDQLPPEVYLSLNASPQTILGADLRGLLAGRPLDRVVIEVTEHAAIDHYEDIAAVLGPLQDQGLRLAIDDAGAGYASLRHILNLAPDIIKLDISITQGIDMQPSRRALAAALCSFASATGCKIVAEGVETPAELKTLAELSITKAQGYFLGRPLPLEQALAQAFGAGLAPVPRP